MARCRQRIGVATARAYARYRIKRSVFVGVPRAVVDGRPRRGLNGAAGGSGGYSDDIDLHDFYAFQVHVRPHAD